MENPCVLITSCSDFKGEDMIKDILQAEKLPQCEHILENITSYKWSIDTKYYTADVDLCLTMKRTIGDQKFAESVQAFIAYFDAEEEKTFDQMKLWCSYLDQIEPEIKMLVCNRCTEKSSVGRLTVQQWCIDHEFELVELDPELESEGEYEDDFVESNGIKRIIQALHAHTWPNLVLKDNRHSVSPYIRQLMKEEHSRKSNISNIPDQSESCDSHTVQNLNENQTEDDFQDFQGHLENITDNTSDLTGSDPEAIHKTKDAIKNQNNIGNDTECDSHVVQGTSNGEVTSVETGETKSPAKDNKKNTHKTEVLDSMLPAEDQSLFEALGEEDQEGEAFEKLFDKFATMKQKS